MHKINETRNDGASLLSEQLYYDFHSERRPVEEQVLVVVTLYPTVI